MPRVPLSVMRSPSFNALPSVDSVQHVPPPRATKAAGEVIPPRAVTAHRAEAIDNTVGHNDRPIDDDAEVDRPDRQQTNRDIDEIHQDQREQQRKRLDGSLTLIKAIQQRRYQERYLGMDLLNPDFALFARAFGVHHRAVDTGAGFESALREALPADDTTLIEVRLPRGG